MKQCCLCGKTGHESSECAWKTAGRMKINRREFCNCYGCKSARFGGGYQPCKFSKEPNSMPPGKP